MTSTFRSAPCPISLSYASTRCARRPAPTHLVHASRRLARPGCGMPADVPAGCGGKQRRLHGNALRRRGRSWIAGRVTRRAAASGAARTERARRCNHPCRHAHAGQAGLFGRGEAALYRGKVDGYPAIFTRYADRLDIFVNAAPHSDAYTISYATPKPHPEIRVLTQPATSETVRESCLHRLKPHRNRLPATVRRRGAAFATPLNGISSSSFTTTPKTSRSTIT